MSPILIVLLDTKCLPNINLLFLVKNFGVYRFIVLQYLSLTKWYFIRIAIVHDNIPVQKCWDANYTKLCFNNRHRFHVVDSSHVVWNSGHDLKERRKLALFLTNTRVVPSRAVKKRITSQAIWRILEGRHLRLINAKPQYTLWRGFINLVISHYSGMYISKYRVQLMSMCKITITALLLRTSTLGLWSWWYTRISGADQWHILR